MGNKISPSESRVVIVGGGAGGSKAAKLLDPLFNVILIDSKDHLEVTPASPHTVVAPTREEAAQRFAQTIIRHSDYVKRGRVIVSLISSLSDDFKSITLTNGEVIEFDFLILATGSIYAAPWKWPIQSRTMKEREQGILDAFDALQAAKNILVIGGGSVGVEVASEIAEVYPHKQIALVHSQPRLLEREHPKLGKKAEKFFRSRANCTLHLNERAVRVEEKKGDVRFKLSQSNKMIEADLVYVCTGQVPSTEYMKVHHAQRLNNKGEIKVNQYLQLEDVPHVFAIGDCSDLKVEKMAKNADFQAVAVTNNIKALDKRASLSPIGAAPPGFAVSLGPKGGVMNAGLNITGWSSSSGSSIVASLKRWAPKHIIETLKS